MQEYYFLFALAFAYTLFATIQDLKYREVANWLNFSFIAFALAYRTLFAAQTSDLNFFLFGLLGFAAMFVLGNAFYYMKAFAGGDAKLLMGFGAIIPYQTYFQVLIYPVLFVFLLFLCGAVWSLLYSLAIVAKNKKKFFRELKNKANKNKLLLYLSLTIMVISLIVSIKSQMILFVTILSLIFPLYIYTKSLEQCLIVLTPPSKLTEGDWLEKEIRINSKTTIKKSVHGLSYKDIQLLKKYNKSVLIKNGIPFVPAFLIALIIMVLFLIVLPLPLRLFSLFL